LNTENILKLRFLKFIIATLPYDRLCKFVGDFVPIFMLHRIVDTNNNPDIRQISLIHKYCEYLIENNYQTISLDELVENLRQNSPLPHKTVVFTVDDGFSDQFEVIAPIFSKYKIPLTCFVSTDLIDQKSWLWDDQVRYILEESKKNNIVVKLPNGSGYQISLKKEIKKTRQKLIAKLKKLDQTHIYAWIGDLYNAAGILKPNKAPEKFRGGSWSQLLKFTESGHRIAAHSKTHRILSMLNECEYAEEISGSIERIKKMLPVYSKVFAYPSGKESEFDIREQAFLSNGDMIGAVSAIAGSVNNKSNLYALPRFSLPDNMFDFIQCLTYIEPLKSKFRDHYL